MPKRTTDILKEKMSVAVRRDNGGQEGIIRAPRLNVVRLLAGKTPDLIFRMKLEDVASMADVNRKSQNARLVVKLRSLLSRNFLGKWL